MKSAVFEGPGKVGIWEVPVPEPQGSQVLIKVKACGVCTWEKRFFTGKGVSPDHYPVRGGHEIAGIVAAVGPDATPGLKPGQHAVVASLTRCGQCYYCRRGMDNLCVRSAESVEGQRPWGPAGFSEYVLVRDYEVYRISKNIPFEEASLAEPLACVCRSIQTSGVQPSDTAIIMGAGVMGLLHLKLLSALGVRSFIVEPDHGRHAIAYANGALKCIDPTETLPEDVVSILNEGCKDASGEPLLGFTAAFVTAGGPAAAQYALGSLAKGGSLVLYGAFHPEHTMNLDLNDIHYREIHIAGSYRHDRQSFRRAADLLSTGAVKVQDLISATVPFPEVRRALEIANKASNEGLKEEKSGGEDRDGSLCSTDNSQDSRGFYPSILKPFRVIVVF